MTTSGAGMILSVLFPFVVFIIFCAIIAFVDYVGFRSRQKRLRNDITKSNDADSDASEPPISSDGAI